jgi:nucleoid DNA-binding protein
MNTLKTTEFLKRLAQQEGIPLNLVKEIVKSQFEFVVSVMKAGDREKLEFKSIMLPKFGKFTPTKGAISKIRHIREYTLRKYGTTELGPRKVKRIPGKPDYQGVQ